MAVAVLKAIGERFGKFNELGILIALIVLCLVFGASNPSFWGVDNIMNIVRASSYLVIIAVGQTMALILADFDLSVGSQMGLGGIVCAAGMNMLGLPILVSILLALGVGALIGITNGILIVRAKIPAFIVTLGTMYLARGVANVITQGRAVYPLTPGFEFLGNYQLFDIVPLSVIIMAVILIVVTFVLKRTVFGRYMFAIGGNVETARLSGINIGLVKLIVFMCAGIFAALSGIIVTSRMGTGQTNLGMGYELQSVAASLIGGTSTAGGKGSMVGTLIGTLIMNVLTNGMVLMRVNVYFQNIVLGVILIGTVGFDLYNRRKTGDVV